MSDRTDKPNILLITNGRPFERDDFLSFLTPWMSIGRALNSLLHELLLSRVVGRL